MFYRSGRVCVARRKRRAEGKVKNQAAEPILKTKAKKRILKYSSFSIDGEPCNVTLPIFLKMVFRKGKLFQTINRGP